MNKVSWDNYNKTLKTAAAKTMGEAYAEAYGYLKTSLKMMKDRLKNVSRSYVENTLKIIGEDKGLESRIKSILADMDEYIEKMDKDLKEAEKTISPFRGNK
jgi:hypothetical protein